MARFTKQLMDECPFNLEDRADGKMVEFFLHQLAKEKDPVVRMSVCQRVIGGTMIRCLAAGELDLNEVASFAVTAVLGILTIGTDDEAEFKAICERVAKSVGTMSNMMGPMSDIGHDALFMAGAFVAGSEEEAKAMQTELGKEHEVKAVPAVKERASRPNPEARKAMAEAEGQTKH